MHTLLNVTSNVSLRQLNSFGLEAKADYLVELNHKSQFVKLIRVVRGRPSLILGSGSNILFCQPFKGYIVHNKLLGKTIESNQRYWQLHLAGGENWHQLVEWSLINGMPGLENLAFIPGTVGAAPVQNIGAYGVEFSQFCCYVDTINLATGTTHRLTPEQCGFGYRFSYFKTKLRDHLITQVGISLPKCWQAFTDHDSLQSVTENITSKQLFMHIGRLRQQKLPDSKQWGNAGSFFQNPQIDQQKAKQLQQTFTKLSYYYHESQQQYTLSAAWLITYCGLNGYCIGGAQVYQKQALVLINRNKATAKDIILLATKIQQQVADTFNIQLIPEVRLIGQHGEISLAQAAAYVQ